MRCLDWFGALLCLLSLLSPLFLVLEDIGERTSSLYENSPRSDPHEGSKGFSLSARGAGYLFGGDVTEKFLHTNDLDHIVRAHQLCMKGYQLLFPTKKPDGTSTSSIVKTYSDGTDKTSSSSHTEDGEEDTCGPASLLSTVWSAPNYCYRFQNTASILEISENGGMFFNVFTNQPPFEKATEKAYVYCWGLSIRSHD